MNSYGLIFRDAEDTIWLGVYENSTVERFYPLSDFNEVYEDLPLEKFAFVEVEEADNDQVWINDINTFEIGKRPNYETEEVETIPVTIMLEDMQFPSNDTDSMFRSFLQEIGKSN